MIPFDRGAKAYARETLTVTIGAVVVLTPALLNNTAGITGNPPPSGGVNQNWKRATVVRVAVNTNDVNFTLDGTDPTTTAAGIGETLAAVDDKPYLVLPYGLAKTLKLIGATGTASVEVTYFN